jgi:hypothetical protein
MADNVLVANVDGVDGMRNVTLYVRVKRDTELRWRIWLGARLMYLAALVWNCNISISNVDGDD